MANPATRRDVMTGDDVVDARADPRPNGLAANHNFKGDRLFVLAAGTAGTSRRKLRS